MPCTASSLFSLAISLSSSSDGRIAAQPVQLALDADRLARLALVADVHFAGRIVAHQHRRQARHDAVVLNELDDLLGKLRANLLGQLLAVENGGGHGRVESRGSRVESRATRLQRLRSSAMDRTDSSPDSSAGVSRRIATSSAQPADSIEPRQPRQRQTRVNGRHQIVRHHAQPLRQTLQLSGRRRLGDIEQPVQQETRPGRSSNSSAAPAETRPASSQSRPRRSPG